VNILWKLKIDRGTPCKRACSHDRIVSLGKVSAEYWQLSDRRIESLLPGPSQRADMLGDTIKGTHYRI